MTTIEEIRAPSLKAGFKHVNIFTNGTFRAQAYGGKRTQAGHSWYGPVRPTAEAAAQDYCDWIDGNPSIPRNALKTANHQYDIDQHSKDPEVEAALGVLRDYRAQQQGKQGFVYLITDGEYVKIGYSVNPKKRVAELQTGNGRLLRLLASLPGDEADEKRLHAAYLKDNVLMEWFRPSESLYREFGVANPATLEV